jgi:hypothetical protein
MACARLGFDPIELGMLPGRDAMAGDGGSSAGTAGSAAGGSAGSGDVGGSGAGTAGGSAGGSGALDAGSGADADGLDASVPADSGADSGVGGCAPNLPLVRRPEGNPPPPVAGTYDMPNPPWVRLARDSEWVTLRGQGYLGLRWEIEYGNQSGEIPMPTIAATGTFFRVGGGGGYNLDDPKPGTTGTYMGNAQDGQSYMPPGVETPWHIEYYYLDGEVTVTLHEFVSLNIEALAQTYAEVITPGSGVYSPGVVCDHP